MSAPANIRRSDGVKDSWQTPRDLYGRLDAEFMFRWDIASSESNRLACWGPYLSACGPDCQPVMVDPPTFPPSCGLHLDMYGSSVFCNPPYSELPNRTWSKRFGELAAAPYRNIVVAVLPAVFSPAWMRVDVWKTAHEIRVCDRRVSFVDPETGKPGKRPTGDTAIAIWLPFERHGDPKVVLGWSWR